MTKVGARFAVAVFGLLLASCSLLPGDARDNDGSKVIIQSDNDDRTYAYRQLDNGLRVVLISDPESQKAAASLDVAVGSADDPEDRAGLAHFLEHMLFLGTEKYPEPDDYQKYVAQQGGAHNAYTSPEHTNYFFDVKADALPQTLDRFAQFFIAPLFTPEYVTRERNAVHSEYRAKIKDSYRRERDVFREIVNPDHPMSKFTVGNLETLADREGDLVRDDLLKFYDDYYSADRMTLVVLGRESITELERLVLPLFAKVPRREAAARVEGQSLFSEERLPMRLHIQSEKQEYRLDLLYPVASAKALYREKPLQYLGHLLGHEGEGSLFALLKQRGWVESLAAGANAGGLNQGWFEISMQLTEQGFQHQAEIERLVQTMIERIREAGVEHWRFMEQQQLANIAFRFAEKGSAMRTVSAIANQMHVYPVADYLRGGYAYDRFDAQLIDGYLARMTSDNRVVVVTSQTESTDRVSELYATPYRIAAGTAPVARLAVGDELALPQPNPFIPRNLELKPATAGQSVPQRLMAFSEGELWHLQDNKYSVPKANIQVRIKTPQVGDTPESVVMSRLYASLVNDQLNEFSYPALLAGLHFNFSANTRGFDIALGGYSDRQQELLARVLQVAQAGEFSEARFASIKQEQLKAWKNIRQLTPYRQLFRKLPGALFSPYWTDQQLLDAAARIEFQDINDFTQSLWQGAELTMLAHGNVTADEAQSLANRVAEHLLHSGDKSTVAARVVQLKPGTTPQLHTLVDHTDVAAALYLQSASDTLESRALMALLQQSLKSSFFHQLRTQQQLGYIVFVTSNNYKDVAGSLFVVQSPSAELTTVISAIDDYLAEAQSGVDDFESHRAALIQRLLEPPKNLQEQTSRFWGQLTAQDYEFDDRQRMVDYLQNLTEQHFESQLRDLLLNARAMWFTASKQPQQIHGSRLVTDTTVFKSESPAYVYP